MTGESWIESPRSDGSDGSDGGSNFQRHVQIDLSRIIGDAVGNMSISPTGRDLVLAARRGLYIIDLQDPEALPRFLAQGGTWDCADVQWHRSRGELIVSTSAEKLIIWNLLLNGRSSIEHVLESHYRSITDINWSPRSPDMVASTGLDSWVWLWDIRSVARPALGLCAFEAGGTQIKWSQHSDHILASSHGNEVFVWDTRKGSLPVSRIAAHSARVYGIDWRRSNPNQLITCSLDKTIKIWDTKLASSAPDRTSTQDATIKPVNGVVLPYPVWRARDLPFGHGVLSLPQRGQNALEMYNCDTAFKDPVERFEGHDDTVKEFVWRRGGAGNQEFQLITLSKDRSLRFWPIDQEIMQKVGHEHIDPPPAANVTVKTVSYRNPPPASLLHDSSGVVSIPLGPSMAIFDQVRVPRPRREHIGGLSKRHSLALTSIKASSQHTRQPPPGASVSSRGAMSRGHTMTMSRSVQIDQLQWLKSIKREERKDGSRSGTESGPSSRVGSRSRDASASREQSGQKGREKSGSRDHHEEEGTQTWQDEVKAVLTVLAPSKVRLEKLDAKKRTCTIILHGPWGVGSALVFVRIAFDFPRNYPSDLTASPEFLLDKNPLIATATRAAMIEELDDIFAEYHRVLEPCLSFLRFGSRDRVRSPSPGVESSDEDVAAENVKKGNINRILRHNKNLGEPRTSQGIFAPNGQLICFFRAPPRIVHNALSDLTNTSPSLIDPLSPHVLDHPATLGDAMQRLASVARDRPPVSASVKRDEDTTNILRLMTNLLTYPAVDRSLMSPPGSGHPGDDTAYQILSVRRSTVSIRDASAMLGLDRELAGQLIFDAPNGLPEVFRRNAVAAYRLGQLQHCRIFSMLEALAKSVCKAGTTSLATQTLKKLYTSFLEARDIQMLAMLSVFCLRLIHLSPSAPASVPGSSLLMEKNSQPLDYFSRRTRQPRNLSPGWPRLPSSTPSPVVTPPTASTAASGRGSWSSLFNTTLSGRHKNTYERPPLPQGSNSPTGVPVPVRGRAHRLSDAAVPRIPFPGVVKEGVSAVSTSWGPARISPRRTPVSFSSAGHGRRVNPQREGKGIIKEKKIAFIRANPPPNSESDVFFNTTHLAQYAQHMRAYADVLYSWELYAKRAELLKVLHTTLAVTSGHVLPVSDHAIGIMQPVVPDKTRPWTSKPLCSCCQLPVKGLSFTCVECMHILHLSCWRARETDTCPTGCGCTCRGMHAGQGRV